MCKLLQQNYPNYQKHYEIANCLYGGIYGSIYGSFIEYFSRNRIEVGNSSIVTTLLLTQKQKTTQGRHKTRTRRIQTGTKKKINNSHIQSTPTSLAVSDAALKRQV